MSDKFSIEDILQEVENMTQAHYISSDAEKAKPTPKAKKTKQTEVGEISQLNFFDQFEKEEIAEKEVENKEEEKPVSQEVKEEVKEPEEKQEEKEVKEPQKDENEAFKPKQEVKPEPEKEAEEKEETADEFLDRLEQQFKKDAPPKRKPKPEVIIGDNGEEIIGGFTIKNTINNDIAENKEAVEQVVEEPEIKEKEVKKEPEKEEVEEPALQEEAAEELPLEEYDLEEEVLDKKALKAQRKAEKKAEKLRKKEEKALKKAKIAEEEEQEEQFYEELVEVQEPEEVEQPEQPATSDTIVFNKDELKNDENKEKSTTAFIEHKPEHLLSVDEINNNAIGEVTSFKLGKLTNSVKINENGLNEQFKRPEPKAEEKEEKAEQAEQADGVQQESDEISSKGESIPLSSNIDYQKYIDEDEIKYNETEENEEKPQTSEKKFAVKKSRRVEERTFDYSEDESSNKDVIDDYCTIEDEEPVKFDLDLSLKKVSRRLFASVIIFIASFVLTALPSMDVSLISAISPNENFTGFLIVNAICLLAIVVANIGSIFRGLGSFFTLNPDADSPLAIATLFVAAQSAIAFSPDLASFAKGLPFYTSALAFGFVLTLIGKKSMISRIKENFRLVANQNVKESCFIADERMGELLESDEFIGTPYVACSKSVVNLHNYLRNSYCEDPADSTSKLFSRIGFIASVVTLVLVYLTTKDIVKAISFATATAVVSAPVSVIWAVNSAIKKASDRFRTDGGMLSGYNAVEEFSETDCVTVKAADLFPAGSIELLSLHAMGDHSVEEIILKSASLTIAAGGPLSDVFDKIIDGRRKMLSEVCDIVYEDGLGLSGKIDGRTIRIGNRKLVDSYGVYGLDDDLIERKAEKEGFFVVYTVVDDEVGGMFAVKYKSVDPDIEDGLFELVKSGVTLAIKSNDPNISPELIEKVFEIPKEYVTVMPSHSVEYFDSITRPSKNGNGALSYPTDKVSVFTMLISACKKLKSKISLAVGVQSVCTVLGFGFCMLCAVLKDSFDFITPFRIVVFQFAVGILSMFLSSVIKRIK